MIGRTIGKYRIVGQLGRGGAGVVYKAVDETLGRDVAVKTLNPDLADSEVMTRFEAEATILARLNHPQIATIFELFRSETDLLMVMEFVRGETLDKLCERLGPIEPARAAYVIDLVLSALEHAHRAGIVHRDVKPANVMVTGEGGIKIMDFGIARVLGAEQKTIDGRLMGTPAYMSPEQVLGQEVDGRADLYSVGVLLYRLLTGTLPFKADTALGMLQRQIRDEPTPLSAQKPNLPEWCEQVVGRALAKTPADRFQSAEEFRAALTRSNGPLASADLAKAFAIAMPSVPGPTDTIDLSRQEAFAAPAMSAAARHVAVPARPRRTWAYSLAAAATVSALVIGYIVLRESSTQAAIEMPATPPAPAVALPQPEHVTPVADEGVTEVGPEEPLTIASGAAAPIVKPAPSRTVEPIVAAARKPETRLAPEPLAAEEHVAPAPPSPPPAPIARVPEATLTFETRVLVGTKKAKEYPARLILGEGKITVISNGEDDSPLYTIPYSRVISISHSHGRDPLWNSPQGPSPVARGGGTLGRLGIVVERNWISLRTSTEAQFVALRFEEVLEKRVLLALEERTGHKPELVDDGK